MENHKRLVGSYEGLVCLLCYCTVCSLAELCQVFCIYKMSHMTVCRCSAVHLFMLLSVWRHDVPRLSVRLTVLKAISQEFLHICHKCSLWLEDEPATTITSQNTCGGGMQLQGCDSSFSTFFLREERGQKGPEH